MAKTNKLIKTTKILDRVVDNLKSRTTNKPPLDIKNNRIEQQWLVYIADEILDASRQLGYDLVLREYLGYVYTGKAWRNLAKSKMEYLLNQACLATGIDPNYGKSYQFQSKLYKQFKATSLTHKSLEPMEISEMGDDLW